MKIMIAFLALGLSTAAIADTYVNGYTKKNGTYVESHHRTNQDENKFNNYSTQGNVNPYTGQQGTVNPYTAPETRQHNPLPVYQYQDPYGNN